MTSGVFFGLSTFAMDAALMRWGGGSYLRWDGGMRNGGGAAVTEVTDPPLLANEFRFTALARVLLSIMISLVRNSVASIVVFKGEMKWFDAQVIGVMRVSMSGAALQVK